MAFCKYCGRKLSENEICTCQKPEKTYRPDIEIIPEIITNETPANENTGTEKTRKIFSNNLFSGKNLLLILIILVIVVGIAGVSTFFGNAYKRPIQKVVRGINRNNIEMILSQVMTEEMLEEFQEEVTEKNETSWEEYCEDTNDGIEELKEYIEDDFGKHFKVSAKILEKKDAKKREIRSIEEYYKSVGSECDIEKACKLKTEITLKGKEDKKTMKVWLYTAKIDDDGWKIVFDDETSEDFEDELDDIIDRKTYNEIADDIF
ncbi:MAG: hypothetical protein HDT23_06185 [Ruminococcus sp.]|nr:hypothetical protein [Ruminococcus sp.]